MSPPRASQKTSAGLNLTYFGTISARSAREATGTLEALGTGRATFTWETSLTLWQRHKEQSGKSEGEETREMGRGTSSGTPGKTVVLGAIGRSVQRESRPRETPSSG